MNPAQEARVHRLIRTWVPVFDTRVDPTELRLRAAAVIISLATGPFRGQEPDWEWETLRMIASAEALVRQVELTRSRSTHPVRPSGITPGRDLGRTFACCSTR